MSLLLIPKHTDHPIMTVTVQQHPNDAPVDGGQLCGPQTLRGRAGYPVELGQISDERVNL